MADFAKALGASKGASTLLVLFIPSRDRTDEAIDQGYWVDEALKTLGMLFDGPVIIQCYASEQAIESRTADLRRFLHRMGREARQGAIGLVIDRDYLEIGFPLEPTAKSRPPKGKKRR